jgi:GT2 family glycosyltransferase
MSDPAASVVIACHTDERWPSLLHAIASARAQEPAQMIVAVDHNPGLCTRLRDIPEPIEVVDHRGVPGASGTRNAGAKLATAPVLVFLDDDVRTRAGWLHELLAPLADAGVVGSGGLTEPAWEGPRPAWFPDEFAWVVGGSYAGLPTTAGPVRNVWSENMAVRRGEFEMVGGFRTGFGKLGSTSRPEDTDLCLRINARAPGTRWMYVPAAVVDHEVPSERATLAFFLRRCYSEGAGKVELSAHLGRDRDLGAERSYLLRTLPAAIAHYLRTGNVSRALAILAGVLAAAAGAGMSVMHAAQRRRRR